MHEIQIISSDQIHVITNYSRLYIIDILYYIYKYRSIDIFFLENFLIDRAVEI